MRNRAIGLELASEGFVRIFRAEPSLSMSKPAQTVGQRDEKLWVGTYSL